MNTFTFWLWFWICIGSIVLEVATMTALVSIWFALGALAALGAYFLGLDFTVQILVFFIASILLVLLIRPLAARNFRGNTIPTNADRLISLRTRLLKEIRADKTGEIKANGLIWTAASVDESPISANALVEIVAIEGNKVLVREIK